MKEFAIQIALDFIVKALNKKKGKIYDFLINEKTQKTFGEIYKKYLEAIDELEEENEIS